LHLVGILFLHTRINDDARSKSLPILYRILRKSNKRFNRPY